MTVTTSRAPSATTVPLVRTCRCVIWFDPCRALRSPKDGGRAAASNLSTPRRLWPRLIGGTERRPEGQRQGAAMRDDGGDDGLRIGEDGIVRETEDGEAGAADEGVAALVVGGTLIVERAVDLDHEAPWHDKEIGDEPADDELTPDTDAEALAADVTPQHQFGIGGVATVGLGEGAKLSERAIEGRGLGA